MSNKRRWQSLVVGAAAVGVVSLTAAAVYPAVTQAADGAAASPVVDVRMADDWDQTAALAAALGISKEDLAAAMQSARQAALDQAVADGRLTQAQADALAERDLVRFGGRGLGHEYTDSRLAEALGITVEELTAVREQVMADRLAQAVEDGDITQAQADRMAAQQAFHAYQRDQAQTDMEAAIQAAVGAGALTQAQADLLLNDMDQGFFGRGGFGRGFLNRRFFGQGLGEEFGGRGRFEERGFPGGPRGLPGDTPESSDDTQESAPQNNSSSVAPEGASPF
ncbi:MAG: hypothetical protein IT329_19120 [Caldilineaceae bacterium]|nr:hypothetical protein [Caldilineaceae bacterium]